MKKPKLYARNASSQLFVDFCKSQGVDIYPVAERIGKALIPRPGIHFEDFNVQCDMFEELSRISGNPHFGVDWAFAQPDDFRHAGPIAFLANQVTSWRGLINIGFDYVNLHTNGFKYSLKEDPDAGIAIAKCVIHPLARPCRQFLEHHFATIAQIAFRAKPDVQLRATTFQHSGDASDPIYQKAFRGPVIFNAPENTMTGDLTHLDSSMIDATGFFRGAIKTYLKFQLQRERKKHEDIGAVVASILPELMGVGQVNLSSVAKTLNITPKKLQRLLLEEGTSFSEVVDLTRQTLAVRYLTETNLTLKRIAGILDYSSQETFIQAFHRWFDTTPTKFRKAQRNKAHEN